MFVFSLTNASLIGTLTDWSSWGACSDICNTVGNGPYQSRERSCFGFSTWNPNYKGCVGDSRTDQQLCNQEVGCKGMNLYIKAVIFIAYVN